MSNNTVLKKDILKKIDEINAKKVKPVYVPSLDKDINFKPLTIKHQKGLLESTIDNVLFNSQFKLRTYEIIEELSTENIINEINVIDRDVIMFQLRYYSVGNTWDDYNLDEKFEIIKTYKFFELVPKEYENEDVLIPVFIPTLKYENRFLKQFLKMNDIGSFDVYNLEEVRKQTGLLYFAEIYKFIQRIVFKDSELQIDLYSDEFPLKDKFDIVYNMDKEIIGEITEYVRSFKDPLLEFLKVDNDRTIEIDPNFFQA